MADDIVEQLRKRDARYWRAALGRDPNPIEAQYPTLDKAAADEIERLREALANVPLPFRPALEDREK